MGINETIKTYDFKTHAVDFGGILFTGFAEEGITITQSEDSFTETEGADGTIERVNKSSNVNEITLNLLRTNVLNAYLTTLHELDRKTNLGVKSFTLKDLSGTTHFFAKNSWITKPADMEIGRDTGTVSWTLKSGKRSGGVGGKIMNSNIMG